MESVYVTFDAVEHGGKIRVQKHLVSNFNIGDTVRIVDRDEGAAIIGTLAEFDDEHAFFEMNILN